MSYCTYCRDHPEDVWNVPYHDTQYGFPLEDEDELFGRLILEINQAGLSWLTILKKAEGFRRAYSGFSVDAVAAYGEDDVDRLLVDPGIIRNRLKVRAAIHNAGVIQGLRTTHGSFHGWLTAHHASSQGGWTKDEWTKLFKKTFKFTGGEIVNEFLMSTAWLPGAHDADCPVAARVRATLVSVPRVPSTTTPESPGRTEPPKSQTPSARPSEREAP